MIIVTLLSCHSEHGNQLNRRMPDQGMLIKEDRDGEGTIVNESVIPLTEASSRENRGLGRSVRLEALSIRLHVLRVLQHLLC